MKDEKRNQKIAWLVFGILLIAMGLVLCCLTIYLTTQVFHNYEAKRYFFAFLTMLGSLFSGIYGLFLGGLGIQFCVISKDPDTK